MNAEEFLEQKLVRDGVSPERLAEMIADEIEQTNKEAAMELIREHYTLTDDPGRRSMDYCLICNPHLNGKDGKDGTEAIGKYEIRDDPNTEQFLTGWIGVCAKCAQEVSRTHTVYPLDGHEDHPFFQDEEDELPDHYCDPEEHDWQKTSLVTEDEGYDKVECTECGAKGHRYGMGERVEVIE